MTAAGKHDKQNPPTHLVENPAEFPPDVRDHLEHRVLSLVVEVLLNVHLSHGGREAAGRAPHALLPARRRLRFARHVLDKLLSDGAYLLVEEPDGGAGGAPHHVVGHVAPRLRAQDLSEVAQVSRRADDHALRVGHLDDVLGQDAVDVLCPVVDDGRDAAHLVQLHRVVQLGGVPALLPRQRDVGQLDLELQGGPQLVTNALRIGTEKDSNLEMGRRRGGIKGDLGQTFGSKST